MGSLGEEAGKTVTAVADTMKTTPGILALLLIIIGVFTLLGYLIGIAATSASERNKQQLELISKLVTDIRDCRQAPKGDKQ
jgi:hypothetical protein